MYHKIGIKDKEHRTEYTISFTQLGYLDYLRCCDEAFRYAKEILRYIFSSYIIKGTIKNDSEERELSLDELFDLPEGIHKQVIDAIVTKSYFNSDEEIDKIINMLKDQSLTYVGTYDILLYAHLGPELYLQLLNETPHVRLQMALMIEKITGISVRERVNDALKTGSPIDLITTGGKYKQQQRRGSRVGSLYEKQKAQQPLKQYAGKFTSEELPVDLNEMVAISQQSLQEAIELGKKGKSTKFNWLDEVREMEAHERNIETSIFNTKKITKNKP